MAASLPDFKILPPQVNSISATIENTASGLPGGACNFRELARGTKSPVCGCKRFWLNATASESNRDNVWCFCGHHACFHNAASQQSQRLSSQLNTSRLETPQAKPTRLTPDGYVSVQQHGLGPASAGLGIRSESQAHSQSINTRVWEALNGFARLQEADPYSVRTSQLPSTAAVSVQGDRETARVMGPPVSIPNSVVTRPGAEDYQGSATEIATPSISGTPDFRAFEPPGNQARCSPAQSQGLSILPDDGNTAQLPVSHHEILNLLRAHTSRLDALESLSFSHVPIEEVHDKFELFDGRLLDLEQWRGEVEERLHAESLAEAESNRKRRLLPAETSSFASDESFDITAAAHAEAAVLATIATNAEIGPRIEILESRVHDLEKASLPSFHHPWQVQVVLLPWGRNLRGVWFPSVEAAQTSVQTPGADIDEWTGAHSQVKTSFRSASSDAWTTESIQAWAENAQDWLSPKACGPSGTVFQRLASRGMIRDVTFTASDSRHILDVLMATFKHVLPAETADSQKQYQGLQAGFLPLRKVRKSSRLRFLSHAEMITSATWTASFLESSVFMKIGDGQRRLYVTTSDAYLQSEEGLSWRQIRQLPIRDVNGNEQAGQVDSSIAIEACWSYNDKLDQVLSLNSSFASQVSHSAWSTKSQQSSYHNDAGQLTPALSGPEQAHKRTVSMPSSIATQDRTRDSLPKRQVASFETNSVAPLMLNTSGDNTKRRRLSDSVDAERRGVNFTPRWSREPPSPYHSEHAGEANSRKRGNTPFAYATPHSNTHFTNPADALGDGDTERDSDVSQSDDDEEEWNGMDVAANSQAEENIYIDDDDDDYMDEEDMP